MRTFPTRGWVYLDKSNKLRQPCRPLPSQLVRTKGKKRKNNRGTAQVMRTHLLRPKHRHILMQIYYTIITDLKYLLASLARKLK